jgi:hypothetical protein
MEYSDKRYTDLLVKIKTNIKIPYTTKLVGIPKLKCIEFPSLDHDLVVRTDYSIRDTSILELSLPSDDIKNPHSLDTYNILYNVLPSQLYDSMNTGYFTFVIYEGGLLFGRIKNALEWGTAHQMLVPTESEPVYIAGEIKINPDRTIEYNFTSGSYSKDIKIEKNPAYDTIKANITMLFSLYIKGSEPFTQITFYETDPDSKGLFPPTSYTESEYRYICEKYPDRLFRFPEKRCSARKQSVYDIIKDKNNNICLSDLIGAADVQREEKINPTDISKECNYVLATAQKKYNSNYFNKHPYQLLTIYSDKSKKWYWNNDPSRPDLFIERTNIKGFGTLRRKSKRKYRSP